MLRKAEGQGTNDLDSASHKARRGGKEAKDKDKDAGMAAADDDGGLDNPTHKNLLFMITRMMLAHEHKLNILMAIAIDNFLIPRSLPLIDLVKAATKGLHDRMMALEPADRSSGPPPHTVVWETLLDYMPAKAKELNEPDVHTALSEHTALLLNYPTKKPDELSLSRVEVLVDLVRWVRVAKCHKKESVRLEVGINPVPALLQASGGPVVSAAAAWRSMQYMLIKHGKAQRRQGLAPRGNLERQVQQALKRMGHGGPSAAERHDW